jgi:hypothetical protein
MNLPEAGPEKHKRQWGWQTKGSGFDGCGLEKLCMSLPNIFRTIAYLGGRMRM